MIDKHLYLTNMPLGRAYIYMLEQLYEKHKNNMIGKHEFRIEISDSVFFVFRYYNHKDFRMVMTYKIPEMFKKIELHWTINIYSTDDIYMNVLKFKSMYVNTINFKDIDITTVEYKKLNHESHKALYACMEALHSHLNTSE